MRNFVILFLIISSGLTAQERSSKENLKLFVKDYFNVINGKDSTSISTFLYDENVSWVGTYKQKTYEELSHHHHKLKPTFSGNFKNFKSDLSEGKNSEVKYDNVKIIEDGRVASVNFDYSFWENAKMQNWGREIWTMVKFNNRWKITSVLFSMEQVKYNPQPPLKERLKLN